MARTRRGCGACGRWSPAGAPGQAIRVRKDREGRHPTGPARVRLLVWWQFPRGSRPGPQARGGIVGALFFDQDSPGGAPTMPAALPGWRAPVSRAGGPPRRRGPRGNCHHTKRRTRPHRRAIGVGGQILPRPPTQRSTRPDEPDDRGRPTHGGGDRPGRGQSTVQHRGRSDGAAHSTGTRSRKIREIMRKRLDTQRR